MTNLYSLFHHTHLDLTVSSVPFVFFTIHTPCMETTRSCHTPVVDTSQSLAYHTHTVTVSYRARTVTVYVCVTEWHRTWEYSALTVTVPRSARHAQFPPPSFPLFLLPSSFSFKSAPPLTEKKPLQTVGDFVFWEEEKTDSFQRPKRNNVQRRYSGMEEEGMLLGGRRNGRGWRQLP